MESYMPASSNAALPPSAGHLSAKACIAATPPSRSKESKRPQRSATAASRCSLSAVIARTLPRREACRRFLSSGRHHRRSTQRLLRAGTRSSFASMSDALPTCPACSEAFTYEDRGLFVCPMCGHEWSADFVGCGAVVTDPVRHPVDHFLSIAARWQRAAGSAAEVKQTR
ncbi:MAG: hypothetical protein ACTH34_12180 [Microbacterium gubbeenense]|uniref:hypothetical protein n=1 Tax=Microbacterium gubbeenense TaxID=159896 RepID=UPI003F99FBB3